MRLFICTDYKTELIKKKQITFTLRKYKFIIFPETIFFVIYFGYLGKKMDMLNAQQLDALVKNGAIRSISVDGTSDGFMILVNGTLIGAKLGHARVFKKLNTAAAFLKNKGIGKFNVDVSRWSPEQSPLQ